MPAGWVLWEQGNWELVRIAEDIFFVPLLTCLTFSGRRNVIRSGRSWSLSRKGVGAASSPRSRARFLEGFDMFHVCKSRTRTSLGCLGRSVNLEA